MDVKVIDESRLESDETEKQYFKFSSTEAEFDWNLTVMLSVRQVLNQIGALILKTKWVNNICYDKSTLDIKIDELLSIYRKSIEEPMNRFNIELRMIFHVPENVPLYKTLNVKYTDKDVLMLRLEITKLESQLVSEEAFVRKCQLLKEGRLTDLLKNMQKIKLIFKGTSLKDKVAGSKRKELLQVVKNFYSDAEMNSNLLLAEMKYCSYNYKTTII